MTSTLIDRIGTLVTNDPALGSGPLGVLEDAALLLQDGAVAWVGPRTAVPEGAPSCPVSSTATATSSSPATGRRSSRRA